MRNQKGIALVTLVLTFVVLFILAAVTFYMVTGLPDATPTENNTVQTNNTTENKTNSTETENSTNETPTQNEVENPETTDVDSENVTTEE